jgi:ABC-type lipoprotein release transport system permease subunit
LYGISPCDGVTLSLTVGAILLASLAAAWLPALRASQLDPIQVLRSE